MLHELKLADAPALLWIVFCLGLMAFNLTGALTRYVRRIRQLSPGAQVFVAYVHVCGFVAGWLLLRAVLH